MTIRLTSMIALAASLTPIIPVWANSPSPQALSQTCAACHGTNGASVGIIPTIAGADPEYFVETMQKFRDGSRKATVMDRIAKGYSDGELEKMAQYFAKQPAVAMKQDYSPEKSTLGAKLHKDYCEKCHEEGGKNPESNSVLAGQSMLYLQYSMADFQAGDRETPEKMRKRLDQLVEEHGADAIDAVFHYYASQQ